jgi:hypothetical protein
VGVVPCSNHTGPAALKVGGGAQYYVHRRFRARTTTVPMLDNTNPERPRRPPAQVVRKAACDAERGPRGTGSADVNGNHAPPAFAEAWQATPPTLSRTRTASELCELSLSLSLVSFFCIPKKSLDMPALPRKNGVSRLHLEVGYCSGWKWKQGPLE